MLKNENENLKKKICFSTSNWMVDFYWNIKGLLVTVKFQALLLALPILYLGETLVWLVDFLQEVEKLHTFCKASLGVKEWLDNAVGSCKSHTSKLNIENIQDLTKMHDAVANHKLQNPLQLTNIFSTYKIVSACCNQFCR